MADDIDPDTRELERDQRDAERWRYFADAADREISFNGDNFFVRYVGPWVVAEVHRDPEDGDSLTPDTPNDWLDGAVREGKQDSKQALDKPKG